MKYQLISCVWELTLKCNLRCIHCGSNAGKQRDNELSLDEAIALCYDLKRTGCKSVALMGGEPLLSSYFYDVAKKIKELGMEVSVITNGTIINNEIFDFLKEIKPHSVATSIDGIGKTHDRIRGVEGAFEKTGMFIEKALEYNLPVSVITSVSKLNISQLSKIADMIKGKGIAWQIQTVGTEGKRFDKRYILDEDEFYSVGVFIEMARRRYTVDELPVIGAHDLGYNSCFIKNIYLYDKWRGCEAGISVVGIRSNGDVLGCLSINDDRYIEGNVRKKSLYDIWNDENSFSYTRKFKPKDAGPNCIKCKHLATCKGGCCDISLTTTGMMHNDPYCFYRYEKEKMNIFQRTYLKIYSKILKYSSQKRLIEIFSGKRK